MTTHRSLRLFAFAACACAPQPAPVAPAPAVPAANAAAAPVPAPAPASVSSAPSAAPESTPFHVVAEGAMGPIELVRVGDRLLLDGGPAFLTEIRDGKVMRDDRYARALPGLRAITGVAGTWPDDTWLTVNTGDGRTGWGLVYRWTPAGWKQHGAQLARTWVYVGVSDFTGGSKLALAYWSLPFGPGKSFEFKVLDGPRPRALPVLAKSSNPDCRTRIEPDVFFALPSGHVFVLGTECSTREAAVEVWQPGQTESTVTPLAGAKDDPWSDPLHAVGSANDVWLAYRGNRLAHFDGARFRAEQAPTTQPVASISVASDGTLWLVAKSSDFVRKPAVEPAGELWRRARDGAWTRVTLPDPPDFPERARGATSVVALGAGDVWITASGRLLRTGAPVAPQRIDWEFDQQLAASSFRVPRAATPQCKELFVLLYGLTRVAPPDYDYPLTRAALKGRSEFASARFVETTENGRRFFGAFVSDYASGKSLVKLVENKVKGSIPQLLCHQPEVTRRFDIDLATGELRSVTPAGS